MYLMSQIEPHKCSSTYFIIECWVATLKVDQDDG